MKRGQFPGREEKRRNHERAEYGFHTFAGKGRPGKEQRGGNPYLGSRGEKEKIEPPRGEKKAKTKGGKTRKGIISMNAKKKKDGI